MADQKISALTNDPTPQGVDLVPIVNTGASQTQQSTLAQFFNVLSSLFTVKDSSDTSKKVAFDVSGITTATTRTLTVPDANTTIVGTNTTQILTNKSLSTGTKINTSGSDTTGSMYYKASDGSLTPVSGTFGQIISFDSSNLPTAIPNPSASNASTTVKGVVEEATLAETLAKTQTGSTGAELFVNPSTLTATKYNDYVTDTGSADVYAIAPSPTLTAYVTGQEFTWKCTHTNTTTTPTLNVNGLGAKTMINPDGSALVAGQIKTSAMIKSIYDGTNMQVQSISSYAIPLSGVSGSTVQYTDATPVTGASSISKTFKLLIPGMVTVQYDANQTVDTTGSPKAVLSLSAYAASSPNFTQTLGSISTSYQTFSFQLYLTPGQYTLTISNTNSRTNGLQNLNLLFNTSPIGNTYVTL